MVITRDPDKGTRNVGCYRMQVYDKRTTGMHWQLHKTGRRHMRRYKELGQQRMPVAVALGGDPVLPYAATAPLPDGIDEFLFAGFLRRKPVEMVRCKTIDLEVPASADFVLEGYVDVDELRREGPFGDHTGYYSLADDYPVFHITAITRRETPIYATTVVGPPPQEDAWLGKATERLFLPLLQMTFPEIVDMNLPIEGVFHNLCIVSIKKEYPHHARKICHSLWGMGQMMFAKCIVVVDDDVNVQNVREVAWRTLNNIDAKRDVFFAEGPIDVLDHASAAFGFGGKLGVDATRKWKEEGFTREWPEVLKMDPAVDARAAALLEGAGAVSAATSPRRPASPRRARTSAACSTASRGATTPTNRAMSVGVDVVWRKQGDRAAGRGAGRDAALPRSRRGDAGRRAGDRAPRAGRARRGRRLRARDAASRARRRCRAGAQHRRARRRRPPPALSRRRLRRRVLRVLRPQPRRSAARRCASCGGWCGPAGASCMLEFLRPERPRLFFDRVYNAHVLPLIGWVVTGDRDAYRYLPDVDRPLPLAARSSAALLREVGFADGRDARRCSRRASPTLVVAS